MSRVSSSLVTTIRIACIFLLAINLILCVQLQSTPLISTQLRFISNQIQFPLDLASLFTIAYLELVYIESGPAFLSNCFSFPLVQNYN